MQSSSSPAPKAARSFFPAGTLVQYDGKHGKFQCKVIGFKQDQTECYTVRRFDGEQTQSKSEYKASLDEVFSIDSSSTRGRSHEVSIRTTQVLKVDPNVALERIAKTTSDRIPKKKVEPEIANAASSHISKRKRDDDAVSDRSNKQNTQNSSSSGKITKKPNSNVKKDFNDNNDDGNDFTKKLIVDFFKAKIVINLSDIPLIKENRTLEKEIKEFYYQGAHAVLSGPEFLSSYEAVDTLKAGIDSLCEEFCKLLKKHLPHAFSQISGNWSFTADDANSVIRDFSRRLKVETSSNRPSCDSALKKVGSRSKGQQPVQEPAPVTMKSIKPAPAPAAAPRILSREPAPQMLRHDRPSNQYLQNLFRDMTFEALSSPLQGLPRPLQYYKDAGFLLGCRYTLPAPRPKDQRVVSSAATTGQQPSLGSPRGTKPASSSDVARGNSASVPYPVNVARSTNSRDASHGIPIPIKATKALRLPTDPNIADRLTEELQLLTKQHWELVRGVSDTKAVAKAAREWHKKWFHTYKDLGVTSNVEGPVDIGRL